MAAADTGIGVLSTSGAEQMRVVGGGKNPDGGVKGRLLRRLENFFLQHPAVGRYGLGLLRAVKPVLRLGDITIVTRYGAVQEVLARDNDFTIGLYSPKMEAIAGRFILGLQNSSEYEHDLAVLRLAVPRADMPVIKAHVDAVIQEIVTLADGAGRLELVSGLTDAVPARLSARYFGVPGPDERTLVRWGRTIFRELFYDVRDDPAISGPALTASAELREHIDELIAARRRDPDEARDDVLERLLGLQRDPSFRIDDAWIRTYLVGLIVGMLPLTSKASALALNVMLARPELLAAAHQAARSGDDAMLWRYTSEAMRFAPQSPGQFRVSSSDWTIGGASGRRHVVPAGSRVFAATQSAMLDPRVFRAPGEIRTDRPASAYLHFGYGLHSCFGRYISEEVQIPAIVKSIVSRSGLRRAPEEPGRLAWEGPFPNRLVVEFELAKRGA